METRAQWVSDNRITIPATGFSRFEQPCPLAKALAKCLSSSAGAGLMALMMLAAPVAPAWAADQAVVTKAPAATVVRGWSGFYAGGHAGYGWGTKKFVDNFPTFDGEVDADTNIRGGLFGLQLGYNHQVNWLVLGIEGDFSWSDVKRNDFSCFFFGDQICSARPEWFATVAGRIGVSNGMSLFYLKGGAAWTHDRFTNLATCAGTQPTSSGGIPAACGDTFFAHQTRFGWLVGGGIEHFIARNWSVKLEYNHMNFGARSVPFEDGGTGFFTEEIHQRVNVVKAAINYHFDWGPAPVRTYSGPLVVKAEAADESLKQVSVFSGFDVSKYSYGGTAGAFIAPLRDLDTSGLRVLIMGEGGRYKYPADTGFIRGIYTGGQVLAGYGFEGDNYSINLLAGANATNHMLSDIDPENRVQGTAFGAKVRGDAWINPTPQTLAFGEAEYSTAFRSYYAKAKIGHDVTNNMQVFVGPEVAVFGTERSNQWRVGAHVTQLKIGRMQIDVSGGYANDNIVGTSAYGSIEVSTNF